MYPDSGFAHPQPSFSAPVPLTGVDIDADPVVYLKVNRTWIPYLAGAIKQLVLQSTWATTDPDALWLQQERVMMIFSNFAQALESPLKVCEDAIGGGIVLEDAVSSQIRLSPDDNCIIQMWCIDHWEDWYDPRTCIATGSGQARARDGQQPAPGTSATYCFTVLANTPYLYPVQVNAGDRISVSDLGGAWSTGRFGLVSKWYCPDGAAYVLGGCGGAPTFDAGNPLPAEPDMLLLANINGVNYPLRDGTPFLVPSGIVDENMVLIPNTIDSTIAQGSISACVTIDTVAPLPVTATYTAGSGPTQITNGGTYLFTSSVGTDPTVDVNFSQGVKLTFLSSTLDHPTCSGACIYGAFWRPDTTLIAQFTYPPTHVMDWPVTSNVGRWNIQSGGAGPTYTVTVKIEY